MIVSLDHDQLEPRIQAHIYAGLGDYTWADVYEFAEKWRRTNPDEYNPRADIYAKVGSMTFGVKLESITSKKHPIRDRSKPLVLGMSYGMTEYGLSWRLGISVEEAKEIIRAVFRNCPGMKKYYQETREQLIEEEVSVSMFDKVRHLPFDRRDKWTFKRAFRQAVNHKIQGPGADMTISGITDFEEKYFGLGMKRVELSSYGLCSIFVADVHDAGVWDQKTGELVEIAKWHMEHPGILDDYGVKLRVPLYVDVSTGPTWG